jgi:hypothetical protein
MAVQPLSLDNIELGSLKQAVEEALAEVGTDIIQRPNVDGARKVKVEITLKPDITTYGDRAVNQPTIDWKVEESMPGHKGTTTRAFVEGGQLIINTGMPTGGNPNQTTIFDGNGGAR